MIAHEPRSVAQEGVAGVATACGAVFALRSRPQFLIKQAFKRRKAGGGPMGSGFLKKKVADAGAGKGTLQRQFNLPRGLLGRVVGWWMGHDNARLNRIAIELLEVAHGDRVLEIGFGAGDAIANLIERTAAQFIAGVDPSETMVAQARQSNQQAITTKRVCLLQAAVEALPFPEAHFSKAYAVSNFHTWQDCRQGLKEIYRVLATNGTLLICLRRCRRGRAGLRSRASARMNWLRI